jgi:hypothetical protein
LPTVEIGHGTYVIPSPLRPYGDVPTPDENHHQRPVGASDATVAAVGRVTEALEWVERARGHLYEFHQMMGHADQSIQLAADDLVTAGHDEVAARLRQQVVGRNVLEGRWTFEIVEEFDGGYYAAFVAAERGVRAELMAGRRHVFEAEMKADEQRER